MIKILLVCSAGMSTSLLVKKMKDAVNGQDKKYQIEALSMAQAKPVVNDWDVVLLGPQVTFALQDFQSLVQNGQKVVVIPPNIYALAKGKEAVKIAEDNL